jgi:glucose-6-phosphate 1-epimerase
MAEPVVVGRGAGGLERVVVTHDGAEAHVYLQGATVTHYRPRGGEPVLFLSGRAAWQPGRAIRGGVPIVFPWFGPHPTDRAAPMHGVARTRPWRLLGGGPGAGGVTRELALDDDAHTRAAWPFAFALRYRVTVGEALRLALEVTNAGDRPFTFEAGLHTYLAVGDVRAVAIGGLEDALCIAHLHIGKPSPHLS